MKIPSSRRKDGFTLVELLVVIAIIAVLAGAGFAAGNAAVQKAKKVTAQATCTAVESAVNNFFTDNGSMPLDPVPTTPILTNTNAGDSGKLLEVLLAIETGNTPLNARAVKYLNVKEGKANKNGIIYDSTGKTVQGLYDPWGGPFKVMLDHDYDEKVEVTPTGGSKTILNGRRVAVWSEGADYNGAKKIADDVKTW
jgi:prepilin-type N-terminal cleavage/methylation domain-containing protein